MQWKVLIRQLEPLLIFTAVLVFLVFSYLFRVLFFMPRPEVMDSLVNVSPTQDFSIGFSLLLTVVAANTLAGLLTGRYLYLKATGGMLFQALATALLCGVFKLLIPDLHPMPVWLVRSLAVFSAASIVGTVWWCKTGAEKKS